MNKNLYVGIFDVIVAILVASMLFFVNHALILFVMVGVLYLVVDHYLVMRSCYLADNEKI